MNIFHPKRSKVIVVQVKELEDALQAKDTKIQALQQQVSLAAPW
jgi:hypothetical protein